jgi:hypothetical protein
MHRRSRHRRAAGGVQDDQPIRDDLIDLLDVAFVEAFPGVTRAAPGEVQPGTRPDIVAIRPGSDLGSRTQRSIRSCLPKTASDAQPCGSEAVPVVALDDDLKWERMTGRRR